MLKKRSRPSAREVREVLRRGDSCHTQLLSLRSLPSKTTKAGCVVPKKLGLSAFGRNHLRRRGYAALKTLLDEEHPPHTHIFFFKKGSDTLSEEALRVQMQTLLDKMSDARYNTRHHV